MMQTLRVFLLRQRFVFLGLLTFLLSVILIGIIVNLLSSLLESVFGGTLQGLLTLILIGIFVAILLGILVWALGRETHRWVPLPREMQAKPHAGLIALVGPGPQMTFIAKPQECPAASAIRYHLQQGALKRVWLIASDEGLPVAESLRKMYEQQIILHLVLPTIKNILDINEVFEAVRQIAKDTESFGLKPEDVIADYTGGTSSMSVGMALAATRFGFSMQFMSKIGSSESVPLQTGLRLSRKHPGRSHS